MNALTYDHHWFTQVFVCVRACVCARAEGSKSDFLKLITPDTLRIYNRPCLLPLLMLVLRWQFFFVSAPVFWSFSLITMHISASRRTCFSSRSSVFTSGILPPAWLQNAAAHLCKHKTAQTPLDHQTPHARYKDTLSATLPCTILRPGRDITTHYYTVKPSTLHRHDTKYFHWALSYILNTSSVEKHTPGTGDSFHELVYFRNLTILMIRCLSFGGGGVVVVSSRDHQANPCAWAVTTETPLH